MGYRCILFGTQDQTDWGILIVVRPVLGNVVQIHVHLAGIGVRELIQFQVDYDQASQTPMEKQQIDSIPLVAIGNLVISPFHNQNQ